MSNSEDEKRKEEAFLISSLPEEVAVNCLARLSSLNHAALSLASKSYRSLVASHYLYNTRLLMDRTESYVYVCLRTPPPNPKPRWYILRRRKDASSADLISIPWLPSQPREGSSVVVVTWGIFLIGGLINGTKRSRGFWILDCKTHTWRRLHSMRVARAYAAAGFVDDKKIYVIGGIIHDSVDRDDKIYVVDATDRTFYYSPSEGRWGRGNRGHVKENPRDWCMIGDLLYCLSRHGTIFWCEPDELDWRQPEVMMQTKEVKGLGSLFFQSARLLPGARLSSSGGNIVLFWDVAEGDHLEIWYAEISLERRQGGEIWGNIEWSSLVMIVDPFLGRYKVLHSVSVDL
ncbi:hypothetical protein EUTSA_v10027306mg [Eutrema salsugineum]|uniref:F-box domain-containing protein n=1 Tax=Eutrema salsugineum TaxID=72664 RepID=V4MAD3_EUTSA|nr:hypothetical protein EUTSA_v10027306mg [Eutrema salsugineum]